MPQQHFSFYVFLSLSVTMPLILFRALFMVQGHEALREGHRLQNRELLREQIEPLAHLLNEDARFGEEIFPSCRK